jgi:hypothetical protein
MIGIVGMSKFRNASKAEFRTVSYSILEMTVPVPRRMSGNETFSSFIAKKAG